jgi:Holliday junction resolvasome RuvABC endonuclease subunit
VIIGLDLSLSETGWAIDGAHGAIPTKPDLQLEERLEIIRKGVCVDLVKAGDLVVIEDFVTHSPAASKLGMVHGVVRCALYRYGIDMALVPPTTLKKFATGKGNATKADMRVALLQRFGIDERNDNVVDAMWLRLAGHYWQSPPGWHPFPKAQRDALSVVRWPEAA